MIIDLPTKKAILENNGQFRYYLDYGTFSIKLKNDGPLNATIWIKLDNYLIGEYDLKVGQFKVIRYQNAGWWKEFIFDKEKPVVLEIYYLEILITFY